MLVINDGNSHYSRQKQIAEHVIALFQNQKHGFFPSNQSQHENLRMQRDILVGQWPSTVVSALKVIFTH